MKCVCVVAGGGGDVMVLFNLKKRFNKKKMPTDLFSPPHIHSCSDVTLPDVLIRALTAKI